MPLLVDNVKLAVLDGLANGNVLLLLLHPIGSNIADGLRRTISVDEFVALWRCYRRHLLASRHQSLQRMVLDAGSKLIGHLCGHERIGNLMLLEILVQCHQIESHFLGNDMQFSTDGQGSVNLHGRGVETETGIGCYATFSRDVEVLLVHEAEGHPVSVFCLAPFGNTR